MVASAMSSQEIALNLSNDGGGGGGSGGGGGGRGGVVVHHQQLLLMASNSTQATAITVIIETEVTKAAFDASPTVVALAIITVFLLSPVIICGNALLLAAFHRYKRLRTPSNCLVSSLAAADLAVGLFLPAGVYFELTKHELVSPVSCLLPYCVIITICGVSILSMTAIAVDRCASLAQPLKYNNRLTKTSVVRYVTFVWVYALLLGTIPVISFVYTPPATSFTESYFSQNYSPNTSNDVDNLPNCSFAMIDEHVWLLLAFVLYTPCVVMVLVCYTYVYVIARHHANAIYSVELSMRQNSIGGSHHHHHLNLHPARYGRTLALTVGLFLAFWMPLHVAIVTDAFGYTMVLQSWQRIYLAFLAFTNSAINPWVYGYRNSEFRLAYHRILGALCSKLGLDGVIGGLGIGTGHTVSAGGGAGGHAKVFLGVLEPPTGHNSCDVRLCVTPNNELTMTSLVRGSGQPSGTICETVICSHSPHCSQ